MALEVATCLGPPYPTGIVREGKRSLGSPASLIFHASSLQKELILGRNVFIVPLDLRRNRNSVGETKLDDCSPKASDG